MYTPSESPERDSEVGQTIQTKITSFQWELRVL